MFDYFNDKKLQKNFLRHFKSREKLGFIFQYFNLLNTFTVKRIFYKQLSQANEAKGPVPNSPPYIV